MEGGDKKRFFDIVIARAFVEPEHLVIISFICHWIHSFLFWVL